MSLDLVRLLDALEQGEDPLLVWGVVDGGYSAEEINSIVDRWLLDYDPLADTAQVIAQLQRQGLLYCDESQGRQRWRTRSAESMRLFAHLRQIFPPRATDMWADAWRGGAALVSDFRYVRRPRAYPRRDLPLSESLDGSSVDELQLEAMRTLTSTHGGGGLELAGFQARALRQILSDLGEGPSRGVVVGAGTGSGKTLAFYLPAFAHLAQSVDDQSRTSAIAIYPRNELLRDQFTGAFAQARQLDSLLRLHARPIRTGALLGQTPHTAAAVEGIYSEWEKVAGGRICPYLACPGLHGNGCGGELLWLDVERKSGIEGLHCRSCNAAFGSELVVLTRRAMASSPPDLLFASTEMLNRGLSDNQIGRVLGVGVSRPPQLVLLDEIHTYSGTTGAQTAMVLRRWRNRVRKPVVFVGLSATLRDSARFFGELTGLPPEAISVIEPESEEMEFEGAEYLIAARSDPTSGASVLSTTIQAAMLSARVLDAPGRPSSNGLYGTRIFVFTDDLDVTNRLYFDLLSAEGLRLARLGPEPYRDSLASLRDPSLGGGNARRAAGQSWDLPEIIGHLLDRGQHVLIGRTSSQDTGVDRDAQVVVATASLEVGFDDPTVGLVIQHKAPRGIAQFIQRRGRAGRPRQMRPWCFVILSDYGRDRESYQAWESLFDPVLPSRVLPIRNRHILRMQATQCLLDWIAERLRSEIPRLSLWRDIRGPASEGPYESANRRVQARVGDEIEALLNDPSLQADFRRWVGRMLDLTRDEVDELLWHSPRAVLMSAVPTLLRRLRSNWSAATSNQLVPGKDRYGNAPLPDFFPSNLFSELSLPEVTVVTPPQHRSRSESDEHPMDLAQALREFAPGRVSRRFVTANTSHRHWVPGPGDSGTVDVDRVFPEADLCARVVLEGPSGIETLDLIRPFRIETELVPDDVRDASNATLVWSVQIVEQGEGFTVLFPGDDAVGQLLVGARFFLHAGQSHVEVRRAATGVEGVLIRDGGAESRSDASFCRADGSRVTVGGVYDVDALRLTVGVPSLFEFPGGYPPGIKSAWFHHVVATDPTLLQMANVFRLGWVHDALIARLVKVATESRLTLEDAFARLHPNLKQELLDSVAALFQRSELEIDDEDVNSAPARLRGVLNTLMDDERFISRLSELVRELWEPTRASLDMWLRTRLLTTIGEAVICAGRLSCPEHDPEGLLLDVEPGLDGERKRLDEVWITESTIGGGGFLEALASAVREHPRRFLTLVRHALQPTQSEVIDEALRGFFQHLNDPVLRGASDAYRASADQASRLKALTGLRAALANVGIPDDHAVVSALVNRVLRPGSTRGLDESIATLVAEWTAEERRLGVEIDVRTWSFLASAREEIGIALALPGGVAQRQQRLDILQSVLWARGWQTRAAGLRSWNPFASVVESAPDVLRGMLADDTPRVDIDEVSGAEGVLRSHLAESGAAVLTIPHARRAEAAAILASLVTDPVELDFLQAYPRVAFVESTGTRTLVRLELPEVAR